MRLACYQLVIIFCALVLGELSASNVFAHAAKKAKSTVPVLGHIWGPLQQGYGQSQPRTIFNGGDC